MNSKPRTTTTAAQTSNRVLPLPPRTAADRLSPLEGARRRNGRRRATAGIERLRSIHSALGAATLLHDARRHIPQAEATQQI